MIRSDDMAWSDLTKKEKFGVVASATGSILNTYSDYGNAREEIAYAKYNQALANSTNALNQSAFKFDIERLIESGDKFMATQRVGMAKNNIQLNGSAIEVMKDTAKNIQLDVFKIEFSAEADNIQAEFADRVSSIRNKYAKRQNNINAISGIVKTGLSAASSISAS